MGTLPELPEVETVRRMLEPSLVGLQVARTEILHAHVTGGTAPACFARSLSGRRVAALSRRGKYLVLAMERAGADPLRLVIHLRMTGRLTLLPPHARWSLPAEHTHAVLHLRDGRAGAGRLAFYDVRKFGRLLLCAPEALAEHLPAGRDPVEDGLGPEDLRAALAGRTGALKPLLLRQDLLCGLGNIYADEALHRAGLHPATTPDALAAAEWARLAAAIVEVLGEALAFRGTTLWDYRRPDGEPGAFGGFLRVYGRGGQPCGQCGRAVATVRLGGRTTAFCPRCQPPRDQV